MLGKFKFSVLLMLMLAIVFSYGIVSAAGIPSTGNSLDYTTTVSTYPVTEAATIGANVQGNIRVQKVVFSNSSATAATASVYELADSTTTIAARVKSISLPAHENVAVDFPAYGEPVINDIGFRASTPTAITVYVLYH